MWERREEVKECAKGFAVAPENEDEVGTEVRKKPAMAMKAKRPREERRSIRNAKLGESGLAKKAEIKQGKKEARHNQICAATRVSDKTDWRTSKDRKEVPGWKFGSNGLSRKASSW